MPDSDARSETAPRSQPTAAPPPKRRGFLSGADLIPFFSYVDSQRQMDPAAGSEIAPANPQRVGILFIAAQSQGLQVAPFSIFNGSAGVAEGITVDDGSQTSLWIDYDTYGALVTVPWFGMESAGPIGCRVIEVLWKPR